MKPLIGVGSNESFHIRTTLFVEFVLGRRVIQGGIRVVGARKHEFESIVGGEYTKRREYGNTATYGERGVACREIDLAPEQLVRSLAFAVRSIDEKRDTVPFVEGVHKWEKRSTDWVTLNSDGSASLVKKLRHLRGWVLEGNRVDSVSQRTQTRSAQFPRSDVWSDENISSVPA